MKILIVIVTLIFSLSAFTQSARQRMDRAEIDHLVIMAKHLARKDLSCMHASDCHILPIGSRACGGPSDYLKTSRFNVNLHEIERIASRATHKEERYNERYRVVSPCTVMLPPEPNCVKRQCR